MRPAAELDIENLYNFFQIKVQLPSGEILHDFSLYPGKDNFDRQALADILTRYTIYTFNGQNYDLPILVLALHGATQAMLKEANDLIIVKRMKWWEFYNHYNLEIPDYIDHVDLFDVAPGVSIGLKMYMGRMHSKRIQEIMVPFDEPIDAMQRFNVSGYCDNDLDGTRDLRNGVADRLVLREALSEQYGIDVRSKSDAQIAEAVIKSQLSFRPDTRYIPHGYTFNYTPPEYIRYVSKPMQDLLAMVRAAQFVVHDKEEAQYLGLEYEDAPKITTGVKIPTELKGKNIHIGYSTYRMGIGGIHSQESCVHYLADDDFELWDVDVKSYYPKLIETMGMYPQQSGPGFNRIYSGILKERLRAKAAGEGTIADGLKIVANGTFGKFFSKYSKPLYAPELGIRVTITGQLALLMLIEMMELSNIRVISANTDGIVLRVPRNFTWLMRANVGWWERATGLEMEYTQYRGVYMRDVNNYIAFGTDGKVKRKGIFAPGGLLSGPQGKHPDKDICADAVVAYLGNGTPLADTIHACTDIRKFIQIRHCKTGAIDLPAGVAINDGKYLGKAVRFYFNGRAGYIGMAQTGNKVAGTEGATPLMELPNYFPLDVNHGHYIKVATEMLTNMGVKS